MSTIASGQLQSLISRIERLEEEKAEIAESIKEIYSEAKSSGFDTKTIRQVVRLRKMDAQERAEQEQLLDVYLQAIGMLAGTPLGEAAMPTKASEGVKDSIRKILKDPGTSISLSTGGKTTTVENVDGKLIRTEA